MISPLSPAPTVCPQVERVTGAIHCILPPAHSPKQRQESGPRASKTPLCRASGKETGHRKLLSMDRDPCQPRPSHLRPSCRWKSELSSSRLRGSAHRGTTLACACSEHRPLHRTLPDHPTSHSTCGHPVSLFSAGILGHSTCAEVDSKTSQSVLLLFPPGITCKEQLHEEGWAEDIGLLSRVTVLSGP